MQKNYKYKSNNKKRWNQNKEVKNFKIKIDNLPNDIHVGELNNLLKPWGKIGKINIKKYGRPPSTYAIVEFYNKDEAEYFVRALDRTGFDQQILNVKILL